ncbi:MAG TPA: radical SAM protein [Cyanobacteria bacterium UBA9971]|nr:radical SAM protein [Cyanobacteria bacterium UBA9971]
MINKTQNKFAYYLGNSMYINVTNLCTNECVFCIKSATDSVGGVNLVLEEEEFSHEDIIREIKATFIENTKEIVFCGYGEPLIKLDIVKNVAKFIKENYPDLQVRINSNGQGNLIHKRNIVPELVGLIDKISISLNAENAELYQELSNSRYEAETVYQAVKDFISECVKANIETTATIVTGFGDYKIDVEKCRKITEELGAKFRIREWLPQGYS